MHISKQQWKKLEAIASIIGVVIAVFTFGAIYKQTEYLSRQNEYLGRQVEIMNHTLINQQDQIEIMRETIEKKVDLFLTVVPCYDWRVEVLAGGVFPNHTFQVQMMNMTLSIPYDEPTTFHVYVSNVGSAVAHLLYFFVAYYFSSDEGSTSFMGSPQDIGGTVLKPYDVAVLTYVFNPPEIPGRSNAKGCIVFAVMSAELTMNKTILVNFH